MSTSNDQGEQRSGIQEFFEDLFNELIPSFFQGIWNKLKVIRLLLLDPRKLVLDPSERHGIGPWKFLGFSILALWGISWFLHWTGLYRPLPVPAIDIEKIVAGVPPSMQDSIRCNLQAQVWFAEKGGSESSTLLITVCWLLITALLLSAYLRARFRKDPLFGQLRYLHYLTFAAYGFGAAILLCTLLQALAICIFHSSYPHHENLFFFSIALIAYVIFPVWHYARFFKGWSLSRFRKGLELGIPYCFAAFIGLISIYMAVCIRICDRL